MYSSNYRIQYKNCCSTLQKANCEAPWGQSTSTVDRALGFNPDSIIGIHHRNPLDPLVLSGLIPEGRARGKPCTEQGADKKIIKGREKMGRKGKREKKREEICLP